MSITVGQLRAARGLVGWSKERLAEAADLDPAALADVEAGKREPSSRNVDALRRALEEAGVIFLPENGEGPGVRLRKQTTKDSIPIEKLNASNDE